MDFWLRNTQWRFSRWWEVTLSIIALCSPYAAPQVFGGLRLLLPALRMDCHLLGAVVTFPWYVCSALYQRTEQAPMVAFTSICKINNSAPIVKSIFCWDYLLVIWEISLQQCHGSCFVLPLHLSSGLRGAQLVSDLQSDSVICWYLYNGPGTKHEK